MLVLCLKIRDARTGRPSHACPKCQDIAGNSGIIGSGESRELSDLFTDVPAEWKGGFRREISELYTGNDAAGEMKSKLICTIALFALIAGHIAANTVWVSRNRAPVYWDQAYYLARSQEYLLSLRKEGAGGLWDAYRGLERKRAPLLPILAVPFYGLLGNSQASAMCVNHLALIVLCVSVYGIGRQVGDRWLGLTAAYLTMLCPALFGLSREFFV